MYRMFVVAFVVFACCLSADMVEAGQRHQQKKQQKQERRQQKNHKSSSAPTPLK